MIAKQMAENPLLVASGQHDGDSTAAASSNNTPRASVAPAGGTKLKLNFGGGMSNGFGTNGTTSGAGSGVD
jgi:hypothetical protein